MSGSIVPTSYGDLPRATVVVLCSLDAGERFFALFLYSPFFHASGMNRLVENESPLKNINP